MVLFLECYSSCRTNVFLLGLARAQADSVVLLLCREPCLHAKCLENVSWILDVWQLLIVDGQFLPCLVRVPTEKEMGHWSYILGEEAKELEKLWKTDPCPTLEDRSKPSTVEDLPHARLRYEDGFQFQLVLSAQVKAESENDK